MAIAEIVRVLQRSMTEEDEFLRVYGNEGLTLTRDLREYLGVRLEEESPYGSLWDRFESVPEAVAVVRALVWLRLLVVGASTTSA